MSHRLSSAQFRQASFFQVNQSRHHLTLCTWSGTPPAARVGLFRSLHPRSGRCVKSSSDRFNVHHVVAYDASQSTKIWVLRRFPMNNIRQKCDERALSAQKVPKLALSAQKVPQASRTVAVHMHTYSLAQARKGAACGRPSIASASSGCRRRYGLRRRASTSTAPSYTRAGIIDISDFSGQ